MKRLFILASAAIVALASCSKTQVVYNDAPEEIGFKTYAGAMTKANLNATHTSMGVFAYLQGSSLFFDDTKFTHSSDNKWTGGRYWPIDNTQEIDFAVYAPSKEDVTGSNAAFDYTAKTLALTIPDNTATQVDWLYGNAIVEGTKQSNLSTGVGIELSHALSKISVVLETAETNAFKFVSLTLDNTKQAGTITVDYDATPAMTVTPSNGSVSYSHSFTGLTAGDGIPASTQMGEVLVFPSDATDFTFQYKMTGSNATLTAPIPLDGTWEPSKHYIYTITVVGNEIFIVPTVDEWTSKVPLDETVQ